MDPADLVMSYAPTVPLRNQIQSHIYIYIYIYIYIHFVSDYYRMSDFLVTRHHNRLFITLRMPITMQSSHYEFYQVQTFPIAVPDNPETSTVLEVNVYGLAIPTQMPVGYMVFSRPEQTVFRNGILDLTESDIPVFPNAYEHCIMALFSDDVASVNDLCTFSVIRNAPKPSVIHLMYNRVLLVNVESFDLICGTERNRNVTACKLCVCLPCRVVVHCTPHMQLYLRHCQSVYRMPMKRLCCMASI